MAAHDMHLVEFEPVVSFLDDDSIVLEDGSIILLDDPAPETAITSFGANATITLEEGAVIKSVGDNDTGILAAGTNADVTIGGVIDLEGAFSSGVTLIDGTATLDGTVFLSGLNSNAFALFGPSTELVISKDGSIVSSAPSASVIFAIFAESISNEGLIELNGLSTTGIFAGDASVSNSGTIVATNDGGSGVYFFGATQFHNSGTIATEGEAVPATPLGGSGIAAAVYLNWNGAVVTNSGTISAEGDSAIIVDPGTGLAPFGFPPPPEDTTNTIINEASGRISGPVAIEGSDFIELVYNAGKISGDVNLGGGNDRYEASNSGRVDGTVSGGDGDDVLIGANGKDVLEGGGGDDTLSGGNGKDILDGGAGDDVMTGGRGADLFIYGGGHDVITDFAGNDTLDLSAFDLEDAQVTQSGDDLVITFSDDDTLTLVGRGSEAGDMADASALADSQTQSFVHGGGSFETDMMVVPESAFLM